MPPHRVRYTTPSGITCITDADGGGELSALLEDLSGGEPGPVERTAALWDTFDYFAGQYELRFPPHLPGRGLPLRLGAAAPMALPRGGPAAAACSPPSRWTHPSPSSSALVSYRHQARSTSPLTEEGYRPGLRRLFRRGVRPATPSSFRPDGSFEAVLEESTQNLVITLALSPQDGSLRFHAVEIAQAQ